jgi:amino acid adenylation domain-containing protein
MPTVVDLLRQRAQARATDTAFHFLDDGDPATTRVTTYGELDRAARAVATALAERQAAGQPVLLVCPPGPTYVTGFLGCLYAEAVAVPVHPPDLAHASRSLPRLQAVLADSGARVAVGTADPALADDAAPELAGLQWVDAASLPASAGDGWQPAPVDADSLALLQYTSGSTGSPKGVMLSHANLLHNAELVHAGFGTSPDTMGVSWLPPYHDMGLIGGILQPIYAGFPVVLMAPATFLRRPLTWLETITHYRATMSGGPNFAFDLCVRRTTPQQRAALDLSTWTVAFSGAEPVRAATLDRFAEAFAPAGFRREAFYPCYGLAEATLIVSGGQPPRRTGKGHVTAGRPLGEQRLAIVDPDTATACPAGSEGEIWLAGPSVARGYWGRPAETAETFHARLAADPDRRYLRTGDLGHLDPAGDLVVTGRIKDLIIVRGRNLHPEDLELAVEQRVPGLRPGGCVAVGLDRAGEEQVAIACELQPPLPDRHAASATLAAVREAIAEAAQVAVTGVVLLRPGHIPRTTSGKVRRQASRQALRSGRWDAGTGAALARWDDTTPDQPAPPPSPHDLGRLSPVPGPPSSKISRRTATADVTAGLVSDLLGLPPAELPAGAPLTRLGLDSLRAIELQGLLADRCGAAVPVSRLLSGVTLADLTELAARTPSPPTEKPPASDPGDGPSWEQLGQRALWLLQRWDPDSTAYQISRAARIRTRLDVAALDRAVATVVARHPALRTRLPGRDGQPDPVVDPAGPLLVHQDVAGLSDQELRHRVQADADRPFDLARGPLFRARLCTRAPDDHVLLLSVHHTITDFWSLSVLVDELVAAYHSPAAPRARPLATRATSDVQAVAGPTDEALAYWRELLADAPSALELPTTFPRPRVQSFRGGSHQFRLGTDTLRAVDAFAADADVTRFAVLTAALAAVLARNAGTDDLVLGAPTSARRGGDHDRLGYLVNPVPLRLRLPDGTTFRDLARQVRRRVLEALDHPVPFPLLVEQLRPARDPGRSPLMQVMVVLQQPPAGRPDLSAFTVADESAKLRLGDLTVSPYQLVERGAAFDLALTMAEVNGGLTGVLSFAADLFDQPAMARLAGHLATLLNQALSTPDLPVGELGLLDAEERAHVLALGTGPTAAFPDQTSLPALFAERATGCPEATAVVAGAETLTYQQLHERAAAVAVHLANAYGVRPRDLVGVHLPRGPAAVVGFWAALASGGTYLPLSPDLPPRRLTWLLADARPAVVLTDRAGAERLPSDGPPAVRLDQPVAGPAGMPELGSRCGPDDLAYALYTSGSTGHPKAVLLDHRGACNLATAEIDGLAVTASSQLLQFASASYDVHVSEILCAHLGGATLHIPPSAATVPGQPLLDLLAASRITHAWMSPSVLAALPDADLPELSTILCGGEACSPEVVARWAPGRRFLNGYGPAETTVCATWARCDPADPRRPPIGRPLPNVRVYLLDSRRQPVPVGVLGEIYIGGVGVGRGYLGRDALTTERFGPDPFAAVPGARIYRTGDLARWLPDGTIDFLGRVDDQVQVRGARVEPGEVAAQIRTLVPTAHQVAVVARDAPAGGTELVAYLAVAPADRLPVAELRGRLRAELPESLLPAAFVQLDRLPLNPSGKLDRRALPAPTPADRGVAGRVSPRTELERVVAEVWAETLGQPVVGVRDHFFDELGGSSLLVARVVGEVGRRLHRDVPVTWMFEHPTVEALAHRLARVGHGSHGSPALADTAGPAPEEQAARRRQALGMRTRSARHD